MAQEKTYKMAGNPYRKIRYSGGLGQLARNAVFTGMVIVALMPICPGIRGMVMNVIGGNRKKA
jgi:hypothetical protein